MLWIKAITVISIMTWHPGGNPKVEYQAEGITTLEMCRYAQRNFELLAEHFRDDPAYPGTKVICVDSATREPV